MRSPRKNTSIILSIFIASLIVRVGVLLQFKNTVYYGNPIMDAALYHGAAADFLSGGKFGASLFHMSTLYQTFLSGLYSLIGANLLGVYMVQILLGSISAVLLYILAAKLFNRNVGLIASALYILYGVFSFYNLVLLPVTVIIFLNLSLVLTLVIAKEKDSKSHYFLAGLVFALSVMARANILLFLPFLVPWFYIYSGDHKKNSLCFVSFLLGVLIALTPFSLLHHRAENLLNPLTSSMGINLYLGNNPEATGIQHIPSPELHSAQAIFEYAEATAESETGTDLGPYEVSSFWMKRALDFIVTQPRQSVSLFGRKFLLIWNDYEVSNNYNYYFLRQQLPMLRLLLVNFAFIGSFALMAMVANLRRWRSLFLVYAMVLTYNIALVAFFVLSRYRMAAVPFMVVFSSKMIHDIACERNRVRRVVLIGFFTVLFFLLRMNIVEIDLSAAYVNQGIIYLDEGEYDLAMNSLRTAIEIDMNDATAYYNLAVAYLDLGEHSMAEKNLQAALSIQPDYRKALNGLATVYTKSGEYSKAESLFLRILESNPRDVDAMNNLGVLYGTIGDYEGAEQQFRKALAVQPDNRAAKDNLDYLRELISR